MSLVALPRHSDLLQWCAGEGRNLFTATADAGGRVAQPTTISLGSVEDDILGQDDTSRPYPRCKPSLNLEPISEHPSLSSYLSGADTPISLELQPFATRESDAESVGGSRNPSLDTLERELAREELSSTRLSANKTASKRGNCSADPMGDAHPLTQNLNLAGLESRSTASESALCCSLPAFAPTVPVLAMERLHGKLHGVYRCPITEAAV
jgi:hypothetical protein